MPHSQDLYEQDFYTWTQEQARLLREGNLERLDLVHLIEEVEDMGKSELRGYSRYLALIAAHLLKWEYQPERRGASWEKSIRAYRKKARSELKKNPGFKSRMEEIAQNIAFDAIAEAAKDMGDYAERLPEECSYTIEQILDEEFWPGMPYKNNDE